jgi:hypothetical protein
MTNAVGVKNGGNMTLDVTTAVTRRACMCMASSMAAH